MSESGKNLIPSQSGQLRYEVDKNRFIMSQGSENRMLIGADEAGQPKVKISKIGKDVSSTDPDDFIVNSDDNLLRIADTIVLDHTVPANAFAQYGQEVVPIIHGLTQAPAYILTVGATFTVGTKPQSTDPMPFIEPAFFNAGTEAGIGWSVTATSSLDDRVILQITYPPLAPTRRFVFTLKIINETAG